MSKARPPITARNTLMNILARREHTEKEVRQKLRNKFPAEEVDRAVRYAKEHNWLPNSDVALQELAERTARMLQRKGKGAIYIKEYLKENGLSPVKIDSQQELEQAKTLVKNKFGLGDFEDNEVIDQTLKTKVGRFLIARGFNLSTVRKVIYEEL